MHPGNPRVQSDLPSREPPKQKGAEHDEQNIRQPDKHLGVRLWVSAQRVANNDKKEISGGYDQTHGESNRSLTAMGSDTQGHTDDCEGHTCEGKRKTFVDFR